MPKREQAQRTREHVGEPGSAGRALDLSALIAEAGGRPRTATAFVETTLRAAILTGRLPGGTPLRQEDLAAAFGVSRMPVREALRQLEAQALIDFVPHKGAVVTDISASGAADIYAIRLALEPAVLERSIPHLTEADFARAADLIAEMDSEPDPARMGDLNRRFHMTLYGAAGRPKLIALTETHLTAFDRYLRFQLAAKGRSHLSQDDHRDMLDAARQGDTEGAIRTLRRHIDTAASNIAAFFAEKG
ncbi:GntR family transcriptional regulator [Pleomorphomonas sp. JP5]|uniref:GntR family transcriptional regulator n=1 Tax=Pleomorphomonas sp. JP5 TaxID=2942998 RepID=UPI002044595E|nr:GntR family transcriptional regulator [Pleomorphomonas sp. JP5]MCM5557440.1 GntR family transcriptional regulator [Pleomorphomonas sp. JP5]